MKTLKFETESDWLEARRSRITGSKLKDITPKERGFGKKIGFYKLIAENLALPSDGENPMDRGHRLEEEALLRFTEETGIKVTHSSNELWVRDDNEKMAYSPDGIVDRENTVEVKCLASEKHIEAFLTQKIPSEYEQQKIQSFIVNEDQQTLYFCFYNPLLSVQQFFFILVTREQIQDEIDEYLEIERQVLEEVQKIVLDLSF